MNNKIVNRAFSCVIELTKQNQIDESHALKHSIEVFHYCSEIIKSEIDNNPQLNGQEHIIYVSAILHDMCDKKYVVEQEGISQIYDYMKDCISNDDFQIITRIITTMSYSKVQKNGYHEMGEYQLAYHIVREADLLAAYDIDRCIIFGMYIDKLEYTDALKRAKDLFTTRVLTYIEDKLFITEYSQRQSRILHDNAVSNIKKI
jgi:HD superfamily phosphodiesterase